MVIWLIGMSASGKTTVAQEMIKLLRRRRDETWVLVDGDAFRNIMAEDLGHSVEARRKNADRLCALCAFLDHQGVNVLACVLSIFHESQDWLRDNIRDYRQVYLRVDYEKLKQRDNKQLYEKAEKGEIEDVVGVQIPFPEPRKSDFVLDNNQDGVSPAKLARTVMDGLELEIPRLHYRYTDNDLLAAPFKYEYLPFEGREFLPAYRENRTEAIESLTARLDGCERSVVPEGHGDSPGQYHDLAAYLLRPVSSMLQGGAESLIADLASEMLPSGYMRHFFGKEENDFFITRKYLVSELEAVSGSSWEYSRRRKTLLTLLWRFEVSKKIFTHYSLPDLRKVERDFSDILNFVLFHHLLIEAHAFAPARARMALANGMLKMGDLLVSIAPRFCAPAHLALLGSSLWKELQLMEKDYGI